jgi:hypothetical protein
MKTKKRFFLKAAGISLAKGAGISLALVMMFAMAFAACDTGTSSGGRTPTVPGGDGDYEAPPVSRIFKSDANGTVELTITEILSASTQTADTQTVDSRTAFSIAAPTSGERFYYAIRVKGYSAPVSQGTVTAGEPVWTFTPVAGNAFIMTATGSGASLTFAATKITAYDGSVVEIPALSVTGSSKDSGTGSIPSGPSAAQQAATALVTALGSDKAEVTGDGTTVRLKKAVTLVEGETLSIQAGVKLEAAKALTIAAGAKLEVASGGTVTVEHNGGSIVFLADDGNLKAEVANNGTIELNTAPTNFEEILKKSTGSGSIKLNAAVAEDEGLGGPLALGQALEIADGGSITFDDTTTKAFNGGSVTISGTGVLDLGEAEIESLGATIVNNGTVKTSTTTGTTLKTILANVTGNITASGANISLPTSGTTTVKTGTTLTVSGSLTVPSTAGLTLTDASSKVAVTGTLDLSGLASPANNNAVTLNGGTIVVAENGIFVGPDATSTQGKTPQIDWDGGTIVFNKGSKGYFSAATGAPYIGPLPDSNNPLYTWDEDSTKDGTVTLTGTELILDGYLTSAQNNYIADKATINGTLTVAKALTLGADAELVVETGGTVKVANEGTLDLAALTADNAVDLKGTIDVAENGTLNVPAPENTGDNAGKTPEIVYGDSGSVKVNWKGTVNIGGGDYIAANGPALYTWTDSGPLADGQEQYVTLKKDNETFLHGNLTANSSITVNKGETTTIDTGATLTLAPAPDPVPNDSNYVSRFFIDGDVIVSGTIKVAAADSANGKPAVGWVELRETGSKLTLLPGGKLDIAAGSSLYTFSGGPVTSTPKVTVYEVSSGVLGAATKATVATTSSTVHTLTKNAAWGTINVKAGGLHLDITTGASATSITGKTVASDTEGTLVAGTDTAVVFEKTGT